MNDVSKVMTAALLRREAERIEQSGNTDDWTLQGLGMLRHYLWGDGDYRLHIWHPELAFDKASPVHDHPWDFVSCVIVGSLENHTFVPVHDEKGDWWKHRLHCGEGGGLLDNRIKVSMMSKGTQFVREGCSYSMGHTDVHMTHSQPGTVTLIKRYPMSTPDEAWVFYRVGDEWGSAEPRMAEPEEVLKGIHTALQLF